MSFNNNLGELINDDENDSDYEDNCRPESKSKDIKTTGFTNIVKRIQLVARLSKGNQSEDCYNEDEKLNAYLKQQSKSVSRKESKQNSLMPNTKIFNVIREKFTKVIRKGQIKSFINGEIKFLQKDRQYDLKPFVSVEPTITSKELDYILKEKWQLFDPKIIALIVSGKSRQSHWKNEKQIKNFQIGIAKAAMSTDIRIITNGLNCAATSYVANAIDNEFKKAKLKNLSRLENTFQLFGIAVQNHLIYGDKFSNIEKNTVLPIENTGYNDGNKFELNPDHSHFFILKNFTNTNDFVIKLMDLFIGKELETEKSIETPIVSILVEGEPENANLILNLVKKQIPLVVLQGSSGLADIVSYAYTRISDTFAGSCTWDPDYIEEYIKPLLNKKITQQFEGLTNNLMVRNMIRDQVIECVRLSKQDGRDYLMILDMHNINSCDLENLREHLLKSILKSRRNVDFSSQNQFLKDFDLIMDWNCANVARNLLFALNPVNITESLKSKFLTILTRRDREEFVEIFLSNGFQVHKFLTPSKLSRLFRMIHEDEFFHTVCWETTLSKSSNAKQNKFFIESDLNWLLELCTGLRNFVNSEELYLNSQGKYTSDSLSAERKALTLLSLWAVTQNRYELVEVLWKYSDHPVHLALIISMFFERLSWHVFDTNLKAELQQNSQRFANYANGVLNRCYNENITLAYNVLRESIKDWNYMTAVDIAANAGLKQFLAHPCCQKWLTNTFQGKIRLREITWGFFTIPVAIKILLCSLFLFPMYIWVRFKNEENDETESNKKDLEEEFDAYDDIFTVNPESKNNNITETAISFKNEPSANGEIGFINKGFQDIQTNTKAKSFINARNYREVFVKKQPPLWKMIHMMWCSPISKFYTSQLFYMIFLVLISLSALYPNCGFHMLDSIVCIWSSLIVISYSRHVYILLIKYSSISIISKIFEIFLILSFTIIFSITRVFKIYFYPIYWQKIIICLALLYFYYHLFQVYLPISPTLGPFLYRFRLMITVDFINYMRITIVILIANSIAIRALQYPYQDLSYESISSVFHQGIVSLFTGPPSGTINVQTDLQKQNQFCGNPPTHSKYDNSTTFLLEDDPLIIYIFVFQYFIIVKLILGPLLFSIFAVTASKWVAEIDSIWKFQRYHLVIDFANRLALPEPLSLIYYIYLVFNYLFGFFKKFVKNSINEKRSSKPDRNQNIISAEDCMYWKHIAAEYLDDEKRKIEESLIIHKQWDCVRDITEEIEYEKKVLREIKNKIFELEKLIQTKTDTNYEQKKLNLETEVEMNEKPLSRSSPYPGTDFHRYPLPRKFISWRMSLFSYEPTYYTKSKKEFPSDLTPFVDEDILKIKRDSINKSKQDELNKLPIYRWNDLEIDSINDITIDRQSYQHQKISKCDVDCWLTLEKVEYQLEDNFLPLNPFGRTGLRGKGHLLRWGPNHHCILIIAQIIKNNSNGKKQVMILFESKTSNELKLIKRYVNNQQEIYDFLKKIFKLSTINMNTHKDLEQSLQKILKETTFQFKLIQTGYLDDPMNTDNAWKEANIYLLAVFVEDSSDSKNLIQKIIQKESSAKDHQLIWLDTTATTEQCLARLSLVDSYLINQIGNIISI